MLQVGNNCHSIGIVNGSLSVAVAFSFCCRLLLKRSGNFIIRPTDRSIDLSIYLCIYLSIYPSYPPICPLCRSATGPHRIDVRLIFPILCDYIFFFLFFFFLGRPFGVRFDLNTVIIKEIMPHSWVIVSFLGRVSPRSRRYWVGIGIGMELELKLVDDIPFQCDH